MKIHFTSLLSAKHYGGKKKQKQEYPAMWMPKGIHEARSVISEYWTNNTLIVKQLLLSLAFIKNGTSLFK